MISANIVQGGFQASGMEMSSENVQNVSGNKTDFSSYMNDSGNTDANVDLEQMPAAKEESEGFLSLESRKIGNMFSVKNEIMADESVEEQLESDINVLVLMDVAALQLVQQVMEVIQDNTGCTLEELKNVIKDMGIEQADLLSADVVKNLVMKMNGLEQVSELLVSQEAYQQYTDTVKEIEVLMNDFSEMYQLTPEQSENMSDTVRKIQQLPVDTDRNENAISEEQWIPAEEETTPQVTSTAETPNEEHEVQKPDIESQKKAEISGEMEDVVKESKKAESAEMPQDITEEAQKEPQIPQKSSDFNQNHSQNQNQNENQNQSQSQFQEHSDTNHMQNSDKDTKAVKAGKELHVSGNSNSHNVEFTTITSHLFEQIKESIADVNVSERTTNSFATRILEQVMDGIKVMSGEEMTSMEMQLYPENLGKLNIQVVSKNGAVTAQIVVQNEMVKEAIESQLYLLKENTNNREVMIEDVEVTVSSHAFEQGMENGNSGGSNQQQKQRRFVSEEETQTVNAADIKSLKEEILEEAMKEQNGSTVSYTA